MTKDAARMLTLVAVSLMAGVIMYKMIIYVVCGMCPGCDPEMCGAE